MERDVKYSPELVQAVLLRILETGIKSETICTKLRPLLKKPNITDEELITGVGDAMSEETGRFYKLSLSSRKQSVKVNSSSYDNTTQEKNSSKVVQCGEKVKRDTLMMTLEAVKTGIDSIKSTMAANNCQIKFGIDMKKQRPSRPNCKENGGKKCSHCYVCGSEELFARGCKRRSGNGRGLLLRDRK